MLFVQPISLPLDKRPDNSLLAQPDSGRWAGCPAEFLARRGGLRSLLNSFGFYALAHTYRAPQTERPSPKFPNGR